MGGCHIGQVGTPLSLAGQPGSYLPRKPQLRTPTRDGEQIAQVYFTASLFFRTTFFLFRESKLAYHIFQYNNKQWCGEEWEHNFKIRKLTRRFQLDFNSTQSTRFFRRRCSVNFANSFLCRLSKECSDDPEF